MFGSALTGATQTGTTIKFEPATSTGKIQRFLFPHHQG